MSTISITLPNQLIDFIRWNSNNWDYSLYFQKLIESEILLKEINASKMSWINKLNTLSDLDN